MKSGSWATGGRILVVDGEPDHAGAIATILQAQGHRVDIAGSAASALDALRAEPYQLLLVHYGLPDRNGIALLREARAEGLVRGAAELHLTGKPSVEGAGDVKVLKKPLDLSDLVRQVQSIIGPTQGPGPQPKAMTDRRRKTEEAREARARHGAKIDLALYVTLPWPSSLRAKANLSRILAGVPAGEVRLRICDLAREPERAERDNVLFSPTLVKVWPAPKMWVLGDLSYAGVLADLLSMCGIEPPATAS
jgi:circadian clock protein KaiB